MPVNSWVLVGVGVVVLVLAHQLWGPLNLWLQAWFSGAGMSFTELIGMRLRKVDLRIIVYSRIRVVKAGLNIRTDQLETHYLAGGRVQDVVTALIYARKACIPLDWDLATAIDFAGRDIVEAVQSNGKERWIDCTDADPVRVRSLDGVPLRIKVKIKVKPNIKRLVGGAPEQELVERVIEAATAEAARFTDGRRFAESPDLLGRLLQHRTLDRGTAFDVIEYDVSVRAED